MIARPVRIDVDTRSGKRRDVAAAWRRLQYLRSRGFTPDEAGGWTYCDADNWICASSNFGHAWGADGPVPEAIAARLRAYVVAGAT